MYGFDGRVLPQCSGDGRNIRPSVGGPVSYTHLANFHDPYACLKIAEGLAAYAEQNGLDSITELTGCVQEW